MEYKNNQKKEYSKPLVRIVVFNYRDVVMASGETGEVGVGGKLVSAAKHDTEED